MILASLCTAVQVGNDQIVFRPERIRVRKEGATTIGHEIARIISSLVLGDAIRISEREQETDFIEALLPIGMSRSRELSLPQVGGASDSLAGSSIDGRTGRVIVLSMEDVQAGVEDRHCASRKGFAEYLAR